MKNKTVLFFTICIFISIISLQCTKNENNLEDVYLNGIIRQLQIRAQQYFNDENDPELYSYILNMKKHYPIEYAVVTDAEGTIVGHSVMTMLLQKIDSSEVTLRSLEYRDDSKPLIQKVKINNQPAFDLSLPIFRRGDEREFLGIARIVIYKNRE